jgi:hypothetical protein
VSASQLGLGEHHLYQCVDLLDQLVGTAETVDEVIALGGHGIEQSADQVPHLGHVRSR